MSLSAVDPLARVRREIIWDYVVAVGGVAASIATNFVYIGVCDNVGDTLHCKGTTCLDSEARRNWQCWKRGLNHVIVIQVALVVSALASRNILARCLRTHSDPRVAIQAKIMHLKRNMHFAYLFMCAAIAMYIFGAIATQMKPSDGNTRADNCSTDYVPPSPVCRGIILDIRNAFKAVYLYGAVATAAVIVACVGVILYSKHRIPTLEARLETTERTQLVAPAPTLAKPVEHHQKL